MNQSRFHGLHRWQAMLIILATAFFIVLSLTSHMSVDELPVFKTKIQTNGKVQANGSVQIDRDPDLRLYRSINARVASGEDYYAAAAAEQRKEDYPLRPFITFRFPTLAWLNAAMGPTAMRMLIWALMIAIIATWWIRLKGVFADPGRRVVAILLVISGLLLAARAELVVVHDVWAGLLICLSLAVHREERWWPSIMIGFIAILIRETAVPYVLLMTASALWRRRFDEMLGWAGAIILFCGAMLLHAQSVAAVVNAADPASQGWARAGGWSFFVFTMRETTALRAVPDWLGAIFIPLALLGWAGWRSLTGLIGTLLIAGYALIFMIMGRPENFYWGLVIAPAFLMGLAFLPVVVPDLVAALRRNARMG